MGENLRQFTSLDYADADMYGSLLSKPTTATPLNLPLENFAAKTPSTNPDPLQLALNREDEVRRRALFAQQRNQQALLEQGLKEREIARNIALQATQSKPIEQPIVNSRDYENRLNVAQPPASTPERQPVPSAGSPPPTPSQTAARASPLVEPTATPAPAALKEAIAPAASAGLLASLPRSLPQAAGRLIIPGVGAGIDFTSRVVHGQSLSQAATGAGGNLIGSGIGGIVGTAVFGPIGGVVGAMVGGYIGGAIADYIWAQNRPAGTEHLTASIPNYPPFQGGQAVNVEYRFVGEFDIIQKVGGNLFAHPIVETRIFGPIESINFEDGDASNSFIGFKIKARNFAGEPLNAFLQVGHPGGTYGVNPSSTITRVDGYVDSPAEVYAPTPPHDNQPYYFADAPLNKDNTIPSGKPAAGLNKGKNRDVVPGIPANNTPNSTAPFFPGHGGLAPSYLPNPTQTPSNGGAMLPQLAPPQRQPLPFAEPEDVPMPRLGSNSSNPYLNGSPGIISFENGAASVSAADGGETLARLVSPTNYAGALPNSTPTTAQAVPINDGNSPVPKAITQPVVKTSTELTADKTKEAIDQQKKDFDDQIARLTTIATAIAALTPIIQGVPDAIAQNPNVRASNKETTKGAVCEIAQPGQCLGNALDNSANNINQNTANLLDKINAGANAAQLALLTLVNTKLGDLVPGGLSGKLQRLSSWLHLDRALNILIWWQTLHNAYMLSANLGQTLTSAISNVLAAIGIKDAEGSPLEIGEILGGQFDALAKAVIGESEWGGIKAEYKKWNRIYQAAANLKNSIESIGHSILSALEVVGSWVASIGNALRKWGEVGDKAYKYMNPTPNFQNKFFTALENTENVVSQIDSVASEVLSVQETATQIVEQKSIIEKSLKEDDGSKQGTAPPEATKIKAIAEVAKTKSTTPQIPQISSDADKEADE